MAVKTRYVYGTEAEKLYAAPRRRPEHETERRPERRPAVRPFVSPVNILRYSPLRSATELTPTTAPISFRFRQIPRHLP